jgi:type 1 glutamine amidotransferase
MKGVPEKFKISDELYHFQKDTSGPPIEVLAVGKNLKTGATYPAVWITKSPNSHVVCITLGHDDKAHTLPAFQTLLVNAHEWARGAKRIAASLRRNRLRVRRKFLTGSLRAGTAAVR